MLLLALSYAEGEAAEELYLGVRHERYLKAQEHSYCVCRILEIWRLMMNPSRPWMRGIKK